MDDGYEHELMVRGEGDGESGRTEWKSIERLLVVWDGIRLGW